MDQKKLFVINQYRSDKRALSREQLRTTYLNEKKQKSKFEIFFISLSSQDNSCGDEIDFLVWKESGKIKKVIFSNEDCCVVTGAAANMISSYLEEDNFFYEKIVLFISNVEKMINGKNYDRNGIRDFGLFSGIEDLRGRNSCLKIIIDFVKRVIM